MRKWELRTAVVVLAALAAVGCAARKERPFTIASGQQGGTYYPLAGTVARLSEQAPGGGVKMTVASTGGSVANARALAEDDADLALVQNDVAYYAMTGTGLTPFKGKAVANLRGVASLYSEFVQILTTPASGIRTVSDLRGKRVILGPADSGTEQNALQVLEVHGLRPGDVVAQRLDVEAAALALRNGQADAMFFTGAAGAQVVRDALAAGAALVPVDAERVAALRRTYRAYWTDQLPANSYPGQTAALSTPSLRVLLVARDDVPDDTVYRVTRLLFDNVAQLNQVAPGTAGLTPEMGLTMMTLPLHPGALRYYKEKGVSR